MSTSTGSANSDNDNNKGTGGTSSSSSSDRGGGSGADRGSEARAEAKAAADKAAADNKAAADAAAKATSDAQSQAQSQQQSQHQAAVDAANAQQAQQSAETYGSYVQSVLDAAPVTQYNTVRSAAEEANLVSEATHQLNAEAAWNAGDYMGWAGQKVGAAIDSAQAYGYQQAREISQAPMDKIADIARNPMVKGLATVVGGLPGLALTTAVGVADNVMDYAQDESTGKQALGGTIGDVVTSFGPPQVQLAWNAVTNPAAAAKQAIGMNIQTGNPLVDTALNKTFGYGIDNMANALNNPSEVMGQSLSSARQKADNSRTVMVQSTKGQYVVPQVMTQDAMTLPWRSMVTEQANKPRYSSSLLYNFG